ncbi:MAG: radical SAM family heme chaperone HemW [Bacteroidales bacterium]|nr:radical SAM family heme chaperone HemW [Bacteroidales bacterium]
MPGLYIHFPFCRQKCTYCGFYSVTRVAFVPDFLAALKKEIRLRADTFVFKPFDTLYIGGGTPSLLHPDEIQDIINCVEEHYGLTNDAEITIEANPNHLTDEYFKALRQTKANRLSIGIQSFFDEDLKAIHRIHSGKEAEKSLELAEKYGFNNLSADLIYGLPGSSLSRWKANLEKVAHLPHLSCYQLTLEEGSVLYRQVSQGHVRLPDEEEVEEQYRCLMDFVAAHDFLQYEVSNFCKGNAFSRHNTAYWKDEPYLGLGPGAHGYQLDCRICNLPDVPGYIRILSQIRSAEEWRCQEQLLFEKEMLTPQMKYNEYVMTSLRTCWGCDLTRLREKWGSSYEQYLLEQLRHVPENHYIIKDSKLILTHQGLRLADGIAATLFV